MCSALKAQHSPRVWGSASEFIQSRKTSALKARFISSRAALSALVSLCNPVAWGDAPSWKNETAPLALGTSRRDEPPNQIIECDDSAKIFLLIHDSGETKPSSAQLLHNSVGGLLLRCGYNPPYVIAQRLVSVFVQQDIEDVD
jgi:hypothetical protein